MPEEILPRPLACRCPSFAVAVISSAHPFLTLEIGKHTGGTVIAVSGNGLPPQTCLGQNAAKPILSY